MKFWWYSIGWAIFSSGIGILFLGFAGEGELFGGVERFLRKTFVEFNSYRYFGEQWSWQEYAQDEDHYLLFGKAVKAEESSRFSFQYIELDEAKQRDLADPLRGPLDLAAMLNEAQNTAVAAGVIAHWPRSWENSSGATLRVLEEETRGHPPLFAAAPLGVEEEALLIEKRNLALLAEIPAPPQDLDLVEVNVASLPWPRRALPSILWGGTPTGLGLDGIEVVGDSAFVPLLVRDGERVLPTLPLVAALEILAIPANELIWLDGHTLQGAGGRLFFQVDNQGRVAVPLRSEATTEGGASWQRCSWEELFAIAGNKKNQLIEGEYEEVENTRHTRQVLWFAAKNTEEKEVDSSFLQAQVLADLLNQAKQYHFSPVYVNRSAAALFSFVFALVLALAARRSIVVELTIFVCACLALGVLSFNALVLAGWWVSPLPGVIAVFCVFFARLCWGKQRIFERKNNA